MTKSPLLLAHLSFLRYAFSRTRAPAAGTGLLVHLHKPTETACLRVLDDRKLNSRKKKLGEMRLRHVSYVNSYATMPLRCCTAGLFVAVVLLFLNKTFLRERVEGNSIKKLVFTQADANLTVGKSAIFQKHRWKIGFPTLKT